MEKDSKEKRKGSREDICRLTCNLNARILTLISCLEGTNKKEDH